MSFCGCTVTFSIHAWAKRAGFTQQIITSLSLAVTLSLNSSVTRWMFHQEVMIFCVCSGPGRSTTAVVAAVCLFLQPALCYTHNLALSSRMWVRRHSCQRIYSRWCPSVISFERFPWIVILTKKQMPLDYFFPPSLPLKDDRLLFFPLPWICKRVSRIVWQMFGYGSLMNC